MDDRLKNPVDLDRELFGAGPILILKIRRETHGNQDRTLVLAIATHDSSQFLHEGRAVLKFAGGKPLLLLDLKQNSFHHLSQLGRGVGQRLRERGHLGMSIRVAKPATTQNATQFDLGSLIVERVGRLHLRENLICSLYSCGSDCAPVSHPFLVGAAHISLLEIFKELQELLAERAWSSIRLGLLVEIFNQLQQLLGRPIRRSRHCLG